MNDLATCSAHLENNPSFAVWKKKASPGSYPRDINFSRLDKADTSGGRKVETLPKILSLAEATFILLNLSRRVMIFVKQEQQIQDLLP